MNICWSVLNMQLRWTSVDLFWTCVGYATIINSFTVAHMSFIICHISFIFHILSVNFSAFLMFLSATTSVSSQGIPLVLVSLCYLIILHVFLISLAPYSSCLDWPSPLILILAQNHYTYQCSLSFQCSWLSRHKAAQRSWRPQHEALVMMRAADLVYYKAITGMVSLVMMPLSWTHMIRKGIIGPVCRMSESPFAIYSKLLNSRAAVIRLMRAHPSQP
jgi:hypothetical protein